MRGIGILKACVFLLASMMLSVASIAADAEENSLNNIRDEVRPDAGFVVVRGDGRFEKLVVVDRFSIQGVVDAEASSRNVELIVSDGSKSFLGCIDGRRKLARPMGDTKVRISYRPAGDGNHLEFSVEYPIESPYSGKARRHVFKMPMSGSGYVSLGEGITVEKVDNWIAYIQMGGVIGPRGASKLEFQFPLEGEALQNGYVAIGSSAWEYTIESKSEKGTVNGTEVAPLGRGNDAVIRPVVLKDRGLAMKSEIRPSVNRTKISDVGLDTYEVRSSAILCPIGTCYGREGVSCKFMGLALPYCWCPDGFTCYYRI